ncbi:MAG: hypothetical protein P1V51_20000 [Deltaproteobacteria bacterium]|nr:hypothetical protein [Deltaproteobacteria bacterium]
MIERIRAGWRSLRFVDDGKLRPWVVIDFVIFGLGLVVLASLCSQVVCDRAAQIQSLLIALGGAAISAIFGGAFTGAAGSVAAKVFPPAQGKPALKE